MVVSKQKNDLFETLLLCFGSNKEKLLWREEKKKGKWLRLVVNLINTRQARRLNWVVQPLYLETTDNLAFFFSFLFSFQFVLSLSCLLSSVPEMTTISLVAYHCADSTWLFWLLLNLIPGYDKEWSEFWFGYSGVFKKEYINPFCTVWTTTVDKKVAIGVCVCVCVYACEAGCTGVCLFCPLVSFLSLCL